MLMEKLMCRNEAVDSAGIAGTQEYQAPPQVFALAELVRMSWIHGQETGGCLFSLKGKIRSKPSQAQIP